MVFGGDKRRYANVAWLRELVSAGSAISRTELAVEKQALSLTVHESAGS